jgi:hypothetical protein
MYPLGIQPVKEFLGIYGLEALTIANRITITVVHDKQACNASACRTALADEY